MLGNATGNERLAGLVELGQGILELVGEKAAEALADEVISALVKRFGHEAVRGRVDYYAVALATADARADAKFPTDPNAKPR